jgi:hypothetical protein
MEGSRPPTSWRDRATLPGHSIQRYNMPLRRVSCRRRSLCRACKAPLFLSTASSRYNSQHHQGDSTQPYHLYPYSQFTHIEETRHAGRCDSTRVFLIAYEAGIEQSAITRCCQKHAVCRLNSACCNLVLLSLAKPDALLVPSLVRSFACQTLHFRLTILLLHHPNCTIVGQYT